MQFQSKDQVLVVPLEVVLTVLGQHHAREVDSPESQADLAREQKQMEVCNVARPTIDLHNHDLCRFLQL